MSQPGSAEGSSSSCAVWCPRLALAALVLGVGILLIIIGSETQDTCQHSRLPIFLLVMGSSIVAIPAMWLLFFLFVLCVEATDNLTKCGVCLVVLHAMFLLGWYCTGCYWTWYHGTVSCMQWVFWVALTVTVLPIASVAALICWKCR